MREYSRTVTVRQRLITGGIPGPGGRPGRRGVVRGWTTAAARRMDDWLGSVDVDALAGCGVVSFTATVKDCPASPAEWSAARKRFQRDALTNDRLRAAGFHWITEWQRRGVPHLHGCIIFGDAAKRAHDHFGAEVCAGRTEEEVVFYWTRLQAIFAQLAWERAARRFQPAGWCQSFKPSWGVEGWLDYLRKHLRRGVEHYQRDSANMPLCWRGISGRLWGKGGRWPVVPALKVELKPAEFYRLRRALRGLRISDARRSKHGLGSRGAIVRARRGYVGGAWTYARRRAALLEEFEGEAAPADVGRAEMLAVELCRWRSALRVWRPGVAAVVEQWLGSQTPGDTPRHPRSST